ncbi:DUF2516 family protein [Salininema proteolyticum]|uniref:DUF2516 family protein n=1 Tax=Salininema proteolyticum TaxID=1607685 RepID=A0ABV8U228_9ACTN
MEPSTDLIAAPMALVITSYFWYAFGILSAILALFALVHCAVQKPKAFEAIGTLSKGTWVGILVLAVFFTAILGSRGGGGLGIFGFLALCASLIYLLDVRKGIKEIGGSAY